MTRSYVVTGGGRGIGRAITERLLRDGHGVVVLELDPSGTGWVGTHAPGTRVAAVTGSAADADVAEGVADRAADLGVLAGGQRRARTRSSAEPGDQRLGSDQRQTCPVSPPRRRSLGSGGPPCRRPGELR